MVATALLDRLLHHAVVIQIEGSSYRLRQHADLVPEHVGSQAPITPPTAPRRRGRPPKRREPDLATTVSGAVGVRGESIGTIGAAGAVNVIYGTSTGLASSGNQFWHQNSSGSPDSAEEGDNFGAALAP